MAATESNTITVDQTISKVNGILGQVSGIDKAYRFVIYALRIVAASTANRYGDDHPLVRRISNLTTPLADTRMVLRLFGLLPILQALGKPFLSNMYLARSAKGKEGKSSAASTSPSEESTGAATKDPLLRNIEELQLYSMLIYYPAEHLYWFGAHKVLDIKDPDRWSRWSCRAWAFYIVLDIMAIVYRLRPLQSKLQRLEEQQKQSPPQKATTTASKDAEELKTMKSELEDYRLQLISLLADLPLAIHWSLKSYPLPNFWVGVFGLISTLSSVTLKWKYSS